MSNNETYLFFFLISFSMAVVLYVKGLRLQKYGVSLGITNTPGMRMYGPKQYRFLYKILTEDFSNRLEKEERDSLREKKIYLFSLACLFVSLVFGLVWMN